MMPLFRPSQAKRQAHVQRQGYNKAGRQLGKYAARRPSSQLSEAEQESEYRRNVQALSAKRRASKVPVTLAGSVRPDSE